MSRFSSRLLPAFLVAALLAPGPSYADDEDRQRIWVPEKFAEAVEYPVLDIDSQVVDLVLVSQNLAGTSTTEASNTKLDVTIDNRVLFGKDSAVLLPAARGELTKIARQINDRGPGKVAIVGYTDDLGSAAHGYQLSRERAAAVRAVLAPELDGQTVTTDGKGEEDPLVPNSSEKNRQQNRRVEIHYTAQ